MPPPAHRCTQGRATNPHERRWVRLPGVGTNFYDLATLRFSGGRSAIRRYQVDPTIAASSTIIIAVTTLLQVFTQFVGRRKDD